MTSWINRVERKDMMESMQSVKGVRKGSQETVGPHLVCIRVLTIACMNHSQCQTPSDPPIHFDRDRCRGYDCYWRGKGFKELEEVPY